MSNVLLGKRMVSMYRPERPRGEEIIGEVQATSGDEFEPKIITQHRPHGYTFGTLTEARARFSEIRGVAVDWPDEEPDVKEQGQASTADDPRVEAQGRLDLDDLDARCGVR
jgi:hypothetical protein